MNSFNKIFVATAVMLSMTGLASAASHQNYTAEGSTIPTEQSQPLPTAIPQTDADHILAQKVLTEVNSDSTISIAAKSGIQVHVKGGVITINGTVPNANEKQLIENAAHKVAGSATIENNINVASK